MVSKRSILVSKSPKTELLILFDKLIKNIDSVNELTNYFCFKSDIPTDYFTT